MMFWNRKRKPKPDPIGDICRSLAERPWEWTQVGNTVDELSHKSGVILRLSDVPRDPLYPLAGGTKMVFTIIATGTATDQSDADSQRIASALLARSAAIVSSPRRDFSSDAKALATAVLAGDMIAARALADLVIELANEGGVG